MKISNYFFTAGGSCRPRMPPNELNFSTFSMRHPPSSLSSTSSGSASSTSSILVGALPIMPTDRTRERIKQQACGKLQLGSSPQDVYQFTSDDLEDLGEIGRGAFGAVNKMIFKKIDKVMAVKRIRATVDEKEQKQLLMDLEVVMKSNDCNYIVQFYGALFKEGDCWICMELMDTSLDKFYKYIFERKNQRVPESILAKITVATVHALNYLKEKLKIIHRDVKPSNILLHKRGDIKLCDFGISGQLVDSIAKTKDAGCRPYMAVRYMFSYYKPTFMFFVPTA